VYYLGNRSEILRGAVFSVFNYTQFKDWACSRFFIVVKLKDRDAYNVLGDER